MILEGDLLPPLDAFADLAEFSAARWRTFAEGSSATVVDDQTHVLQGDASLKFVTGSGFDTGIELPARVPLDVSAADTLLFSIFAENPHPLGFQGNQPVIDLETLTGTIRLMPTAQLVRNQVWQDFRVPLDGDLIWHRTETGTPDLSALTQLTIHLDTWDFGFTAYFDGIRFADLVREFDPAADFAEFTQSSWTTFASDGAAAVVTDDQTHVLEGAASLKFVTLSGFDTGITLSQASSPLDISGFDALSFYLFADNPNPNRFQIFDDFSVIELETVSGRVWYRPRNFDPRIHEWQHFVIPLAGDNTWQRVTEGDPDLTAITRLTIHLDTWDFGFTTYFDGIRFTNQSTALEGAAPRQVAPVYREVDSIGIATLESTAIPGEYSLHVTGTGTWTLELSNWDDAAFLGTVTLRSLDRRVLSQRTFRDADPLIPVQFTEQIGPGDYIVGVQPLDQASLSLIAIASNFQANSDARQPIPVGAFPKAALTVRLNDDDFLDVVTVNEFSDDVSVLFGRGDGTFEPERRFAVGAEPVLVQAIDVNGDLRLDLITCNKASNDVSVLLWHNGTFEEVQRLGVGIGPISVQSIDIDGNSNLDLLVVNQFSNDGTVLSGNGDGTFTVTLQFPLAGDVSELQFRSTLQFRDLNQDDNFDAVFSNEFTNDVSVFVQQEDFGFESERRFRVGTSPWAVQLIDMNVDDRLDLVTPNLGRYDFDTGNYSNGSVSVLLGNGDGTFRDQRRFSIGQSGIGYLPRAMTVADVNNDGRLDLISPNGRSNDVSVLLGRGDGTFETQQRFGVGPYPGGVRAEDVNQDGRIDLITQNYASNDSSLLLGRGDGTFEAAQTIPQQEVPSTDIDLNGDGFKDIVADLNGDGRDDAVCPDYMANEINVFLTDAESHSTNSLSVAPVFVGTRPVIVNLNGDRDVRGRELDDVLVLARDGQVQFRQGMVAPSVGNAGAHTAAEFGTSVVVNGVHPARDFAVLRTAGGLRIATLDVAGNAVRLFEYQAAAIGRLPTFQQVGSVPIDGSLPARIVAGNFEGDASSRDEFALINQGDQTVTLYRDGGSGFEATGLFLAGAGPVSLTIADLNRDSQLDLVVPNFNSGDVSVLQNAGAGLFTTTSARAGVGPYFVGALPYDPLRVESQSFDQTSSADVGFFNADDWPDVIVTNPGSNSFAILYGTPDGLEGAARELYRLGGSPSRFVAVRVADVNHDRRDDAVFLNESGTQLSVFFNSADTSGLELPTTMDLPTPITGFILQDANDDNLPDVIATNEFGDLLLLLNQGDGRFAEDRHADRRSDLAVLDFDLNDDGVREAVVTSQASDRVSIRHGGAGDSLFELASSDNDVTAPGAPKLTDLNGDGVADLIVPNTRGNSVLIYQGRSDGTFESGEAIFTGSNPASVTVSDLDGDLHMDLIVTNRGSNTVAVFYGQAAANSQTVSGATSIPFRAGALSKLPSGSGPVDAQVVNLLNPNGSMQSGLVVTNGTNNSVSFFPSAGNGIFNQNPSNTVMLDFSPLPGAIVNGNLVLPNSGGNSLEIVPLTAAVFSGSQPTISLSLPGNNCPVGIDGSSNFVGDGLFDLVVLSVASNGNGSVSLLRGDGNGFDFSGSYFLDGITNASDLQVVGMDLYVTEEGRDFFTVFDLADLQREHGNQILDFAEISGGLGNTVAGVNQPIYGVGAFSSVLLALFGTFPPEEAETRGDASENDELASWRSLVLLVTQVSQKIEDITNEIGNSLLVSALKTFSTDLGLPNLSDSDNLRTSIQSVVASLNLLPGTQPLTQIVRGLRSLRLFRPNAPTNRPAGSATPPAVKPPVAVPMNAAPDQSSAVPKNRQAAHLSQATTGELVSLSPSSDACRLNATRDSGLATYLGQLATNTALASELFDHSSQSSEEVLLESTTDEFGTVVPVWGVLALNGMVTSAVAKHSPRPLRNRHSRHMFSRWIERDIDD